MLFHDWDGGGSQHMNLARLDWVDGAPVVELKREPQPAPEE